MATATDIRTDLPVAIKSGTAHKPVWTIGDVIYKFVKPLKKTGVLPDNRKVRLGNRVLAKYKAGVTVTGGDLLFVGVFARA